MYTTSEVEQITGVRAGVLRYWEQILPAIAPEKDSGGKRQYTLREVELIIRMNYLINEKKYTTEGARNRIIREAEMIGQKAEILSEIHKLRGELSDLYLQARQIFNVNDKDLPT